MEIAKLEAMFERVTINDKDENPLLTAPTLLDSKVCDSPASTKQYD